MRQVLLTLALCLVSCVKVDHSGEVDVNHEVSIDDASIEMIVTVDAAAEVSGDVVIKAADIAGSIGQ